MARQVQVANTPSGEYDVHQPLPFPYLINDDCTVDRQDFWRGEPVRLIGFQATADVQEVALLADEWIKTGQDVAGMYPVFMDADGGFWNHKFPVSR